MDIELYNEFAVLVSHKNYSAAARELNMSQPTLSRHMAALSKGLNCQLFYDSRPLMLTASGEVVLKYASKIVSDEKNLMASLRALKSSRDPRIRIVNLLHANALYVGINKVVDAAKKAFPALCIEYVNMDNSGLDGAQMVLSGKVDVSFDVFLSSSEGDSDELADREYPDGIRAIPIPEFTGELVLGVSKQSEFAKRDAISLSELKNARFIMEANMIGKQFREGFIEACDKEGFYPNISLVPSTDHLEFFSLDPGDSVHLLARVSRDARPLLANLIKQHTVIKPLEGRGLAVHACALVRDELGNEELDFFAEALEDYASGFYEKPIGANEGNACNDLDHAFLQNL